MSGDARVALLAGLIDDAGLFPPASLSMEEAVAAHHESRTRASGWMLSRFICPASRLRELLKWLPEQDSTGPWRLSVILDGATQDRWLDGATDDLAAVRGFTDEAGPRAGVELLEVLLPAGADVQLLRTFLEAVERGGIAAPVTPFLEVPAASPLAEMLETIVEARGRTPPRGRCRPPGAKLRCGGATPELFPTPNRVASFIAECLRLRLPFKATAGLHHPFRHTDVATGFVQHGFINLVGATVLARVHELDVPTIRDIVAEVDPSSFSINSEAIMWRDLAADAGQIGAARQNAFVAYGSCSFQEPVEDLTDLGILPL